ncbi:MAG TPA: hypothetical protein VMV24_02165 [Candidatus Dormibacteraeota bacterium]|nr:hypothetical protein [Candidatus Dormibacteraeota bacterium]
MNGQGEKRFIVQFETSSPEKIIPVIGELAVNNIVENLLVINVDPETLIDYVNKSPEGINYNPELVSYIWDDVSKCDESESRDSEGIVSVIPNDKLIAFAVNHGIASKQLCNRLINALYYNVQHTHMAHNFDPMYHYPSANEVVLRADKLSELNRRIEDRYTSIYRVGEKSIQLLNDIERALIIDDPTTPINFAAAS